MQQKPWLTAALYTITLISGLLLWQTWSTEKKQRDQSQEIQQKAIIADNHKEMAYHVSDVAITPQHRKVLVHTDTLSLVIDRLGGNVISAKLNKFNTELNNNIPVSLLDNNNINRSMQSGSLSKKPLLFKTADVNFNLQPGHDSLTFDLVARDDNGVVFKKTYSLKRVKYDLTVTETVNNQSNKVWQGNFYTQIKQKELKEESGFMQMRTFTGFSYAAAKSSYNKLSFGDLKDKAISLYTKNSWIASQQHYFITAWVPPKDSSYKLNALALNGQDANYVIRLVSDTISLEPNQTKTIKNILYIGPEKAKDLEALAKGLGLTIDYGWLWFISNGLFILLEKIHQYIPNWGIAVILLTLLIKLAFYRLSAKSFESMAKMKALQPKIEAIKQQHGDNKEALGKATMELYKKEKLNPLGGCLPMLIQIPFFIALYWVLMESVELRHAPFFGWIQDLSSKDPYYVLPIIMGASMLWQQKLTPQQDPAQAKIMMIMPAMFTLLFLSFPSGLVLYWLSNNLLSIAQQQYCLNKFKK